MTDSSSNTADLEKENLKLDNERLQYKFENKTISLHTQYNFAVFLTLLRY